MKSFLSLVASICVAISMMNCYVPTGSSQAPLSSDEIDRLVNKFENDEISWDSLCSMLDHTINFGRVYEWASKKAQAHSPSGLFILGRCYELGLGTDKNPTKAIELYMQAASQGYMEAELALGICYFDGTGVEKDYTKAFEWHSKAASQGHSFAQYSLGVFYSLGIGVEPDYEKSKYWYFKAAESGDPTSQTWVGGASEVGKGGKKDIARAFDL